MLIYLYTCTYVLMYLCTYVLMYLCTYVLMYLCTYVLMYLCTYVLMYLLYTHYILICLYTYILEYLYGSREYSDDPGNPPFRHLSDIFATRSRKSQIVGSDLSGTTASHCCFAAPCTVRDAG